LLRAVLGQAGWGIAHEENSDTILTLDGPTKMTNSKR